MLSSLSLAVAGPSCLPAPATTSIVHQSSRMLNLLTTSVDTRHSFRSTGASPERCLCTTSSAQKKRSKSLRIQQPLPDISLRLPLNASKRPASNRIGSARGRRGLHSSATDSREQEPLQREHRPAEQGSLPSTSASPFFPHPPRQQHTAVSRPRFSIEAARKHRSAFPLLASSAWNTSPYPTASHVDVRLRKPSPISQPTRAPPILFADKQRKPTSQESTPSGSARDYINDLMQLPNLYDPLRTPRDPIVLCHGLYGFDVRGPFFGLEIHYWAKIMDVLRKQIGVEVILKGVPSTGSIKERAEALHEFLCSPQAGMRGRKLHFIGHSMGGLDARYLISNIRPTPDEYTPLTLTTISTPHRGSPFMDWCNANVGIGNEFIEREIELARKNGLIPDPDQLRSKTNEGKAEELRSSGMEALSRASGGVPHIKADPVKGIEVGAGKAKDADAAADSIDDPAYPRPPFSLKTPLFVRRKPDSDAPAKEQKEAAQAASPESTPTESPFSKTVKAGSDSTVSKSKAEKKKLDPMDPSIFTRALQNISGSFSNYLLSAVDQPAYAMLSTRYMSEVFNPTTPDHPDVKYYSVAARIRKLPVWHALWLPKLVMDAAAESRTSGSEMDGSADALGGNLQGNDGIVSVRSARWGQFLGVVEGCDHWDLRGGGAPRLASKINPITGRPYLTKKEEKPPGAPEEEKEKSSSWMDINRVLRSLIRSKENSKKEAVEEQKIAGKRETAATDEDSQINPIIEFVEHSAAKIADGVKAIDPTDSGMLKGIAGWISERLPQGDEDRRQQAERTADEQERISHAAIAMPIDEEGHPSSAIALSGLDPVHATTAGFVPDETHMLVTSAASQDAQSSFLPSDALESSASKEAAEKKAAQEKKPLKGDEQLERFWVAVCHHLWAQGF